MLECEEVGVSGRSRVLTGKEQIVNRKCQNKLGTPMRKLSRRCGVSNDIISTKLKVGRKASLPWTVKYLNNAKYVQRANSEDKVLVCRAISKAGFRDHIM